MATRQEQKAKWAQQARDRELEKADKLYSKARWDEDVEQGNFLRDPEGGDTQHVARALRSKHRTKDAGTVEL